MKPWTEDAWIVEGVNNLSALLKALGVLLAGEGRIYLESPQDSSVRNKLRPLSNPLPDIPIESGGVNVKGEDLFHIPSTQSNIKMLVALAEDHSSPEICLHLVLYCQDGVVLEAYDAPAGAVMIRNNCSYETVNEFCKISGGIIAKKATE